MKDLVEHIRTVHFTLLVVALILTAALQIEKRRPLERAANDAEALRQLTENWSQTSLRTDHALQSALLQFRSDNGSSGTTGTQIGPEPGIYSADAVGPDGKATNIRFRIDKPWVFRNDVDQFKLAPAGLDLEWGTLTQFIAFWDAMHDGRAGYFAISLIHGDFKDDCKNLQRYDHDLAGVTPLKVDAVRLRQSVWEFTPHVGTAATHCRFDKYHSTPLVINLRDIYQPIAPAVANWGEGDSKEEFSELILGAKYLEDAPIPTLASYLRERANAEPERIELFQAKLPASAIPTYGSFILILCQFYLLAHLVELDKLLLHGKAGELPTGYIGLYDAKPTYIFTIISLVAFPIVPFVIEIRQNKSDVGIAATAALAMLLSLSLGALSSMVLARIKRRLASAAVTDTEID